jgi:hypothetical protein
MSSVHAVTEDIVITVKVASFYPVDYKKLNQELGYWLASKQQDYNLIVYSNKMDYKEKDAT